MTYYSQTLIKSALKVSGLALLTALAACMPTTSSAPESVAPAVTTTVSEPANSSRIKVLASYPIGSFLENLEVLADGRILITNYFGKSIELTTADGKQEAFSNLSAFPLSIISDGDGYIVAAQGKNFIGGDPTFVQTNQFLMLDKSGKEIGKIAAPEALFLNGMVRLANGDLLVADSVSAAILKVDVKAQKVTPWLKNDALALIPGQNPYRPGVNGLKLHSKGLLVSNTSKASLFLIKIDKDGNPFGEPEKFADTGIIDDFWVNDDDSVVYTTHENNLKYIAPDGTISDIISEGCNGCTAVAPYPLGQENTYAVINDGDFYFGEKKEPTVLIVTAK